MSPDSAGRGDAQEALLAPLRADPSRSAVLTDVDGVLAPIAPRPEQAAVPDDARAALAELSGRYGLVGCVSGRRAAEARGLVGLDGISYAGNHGLELLGPGEAEPRIDPAPGDADGATRAFLESLDVEALEAAGLRREDKAAIQALHWRDAEDEAAAESRAREVAEQAVVAGVEAHWGRKVLELRPSGAGGKDAAVAALLGGGGLRAAIYAGDDRTDLDAFRRLREMCAEGALDAAVCVGVVSAEGPPQIAEQADLTVDGPPGWLAILHRLAG